MTAERRSLRGELAVLNYSAYKAILMTVSMGNKWIDKSTRLILVPWWRITSTHFKSRLALLHSSRELKRPVILAPPQVNNWEKLVVFHYSRRVGFNFILQFDSEEVPNRLFVVGDSAPLHAISTVLPFSKLNKMFLDTLIQKIFF